MDVTCRHLFFCLFGGVLYDGNDLVLEKFSSLGVRENADTADARATELRNFPPFALLDFRFCSLPGCVKGI